LQNVPVFPENYRTGLIWDVMRRCPPVVTALRRAGFTGGWLVLVSGQVERVTEFESGFPIHEAREGDGWRPDPMIWDDQALVLNVRDRGLVIVSGCSHAGVINVLFHAQRLTGEDRVAGLVGGLHLTGGLFEPRIGPTVDALRAARVGRVLPAHCSGWKAVHTIAAAMPEAFVQCAVGTTVTFEAASG
jgi:7,8-dihydropterin-6-yl-methyl-4-(beta-D-ribofuranosyl)aminobenzene 5'-phosphate synthase